ncbi:MAG TPA: hypothetical protein VFX40_01965 [Gemmatimonadaceae bacterium]|nr:hypothetical protein [Gemmatimonadaceae bacterium]
MNEMKGILMPGEPREVEPELPKSAMMLFAPVDKRAFGVAIGTAAAAGIMAITAIELMLRPVPSLNLSLLAQYFAGYTVSWTGMFVGGAWGFFTGFCGGWFTAFMRNLVLALSLFLLRSRAELDDSRDFLDHI